MSAAGRVVTGRVAGDRPVSDEVAGVLERLSALVSAGVAPERAWMHVAEVAAAASASGSGSRSAPGAASSSAGRRGTAATVAEVADAVGRGIPVPDALHGATRAPAWRVVGAAWSVATETGAPLAPFLTTLSAALSASARTEREIASALAGPIATTRLVTALPVVAALGGALAGLGTLQAVVTPAGVVCLVAAVLLLLAAQRWSRILVRRARSDDTDAGLALDLIAIGLTGGGSTARARRLAREACDRFGLDYADASAVALLELARVSGAPPGDLLRHEARRIRADAAGAAARRAAALGSWLMLPLGLCTLPAFLLLAVAPVLIALLGSTRLL